jgi:hypothetical protein
MDALGLQFATDRLSLERAVVVICGHRYGTVASYSIVALSARQARFGRVGMWGVQECEGFACGVRGRTLVREGEGVTGRS